jgi:tetraprenyl-beta-curcumene synthase
VTSDAHRRSTGSRLALWRRGQNRADVVFCIGEKHQRRDFHGTYPELVPVHRAVDFRELERRQPKCGYPDRCGWNITGAGRKRWRYLSPIKSLSPKQFYSWGMGGQAATKPRAGRLRDSDARSGHDVAPLTLSQMRPLGGAVARELLWAEPIVRRELRTWRTRAAGISDEGLRRDAIDAIDRKRANVHGAALFCTLADSRSRVLLRLLVAYQVMWDFLDSASESAADVGEVNGARLHAALVDALDPARPMRDYYLYHAREEDAGYLRALVDACRQRCRELQSFQRVQPFLLADATRASVQALNHDPCPTSRAAKLQAWAEREFPDEEEAEWFELSAAAGTPISIFALLALASDLEVTDEAIASVRRTYWPWASALATMLDSYVDDADDAATDHQRYITYYPNRDVAIARLTEIMRRCLSDASALPRGEKHVVVIASMIAMYLSKDSAHIYGGRRATRALLAGSGSLPQLLLPVLRLWRICYGQCAA